jgi:hypothetical protein
MAQNNRGRLNLDISVSQPDYNSFVECRSMPTNYVNDAIKGNMAQTPVSELFFSDYNVQLLQKGIQNMVLNKSCGKYKIGTQSPNELLTVMRATYLQDGLNSIANVVHQVKKLNEIVLMYCVPRILSELEMHNTYLKDISTLPVPMKYGENTNVAGTKTLELKHFF